MAVCTPTLEGVSSIATRPLNLSLLTKKRAMEGLYENGVESEDGCNNSSKRLKRDEESSEQEDKQDEEIIVHEERPLLHQQEQNGGDKSRSSILEHFYSFIRRKTDETMPTNRPGEDYSKYGDRDEISPYGMASDDKSDSESEKLRHNGSQSHAHRRMSPPTTPDRCLIDYNATIGRQIAARGGPANFIDIWSAVAANALARVKSSNVKEQRTSPPFPSLINLGNDYEQKTNFTSTAATTAIPERTMRQNNWAVKVWRDWAIERNSRANLNGKTGPYEIVPLDIKDASVEMMSFWLPRFITEVRRRDKRPYPPDTLMQIASGLQRHLRHVSGRSDITFFDKYSPTFAEFREALKARSDVINSKLSNTRREAGSGQSPNCNDAALSDPWSSSLFNLSTAKGLFRAIFYSNCVTFHITSMEEHHSLLVSQFHIGLDGTTGLEFLEFTRENGEVTRKLASPYDSRCVVKIFKKYFECIPPTGLLYKRPLQSTDGADLRFSFNPVGINKLRETFKILFGGRRTGAHIPTMEDEEEREGRSSPMRYHSTEEDRRFSKFNHSPSSNASSGRASFHEDDSGEENRRPCEQENEGHTSSPSRSVITYASDSKVNSTTAKDEIATQRQSILEENNNNNSSKVEDDDCLTLKVPAYVKSVVILQGGKRFQVDLSGMS